MFACVKIQALFQIIANYVSNEASGINGVSSFFKNTEPSVLMYLKLGLFNTYIGNLYPPICFLFCLKIQTPRSRTVDVSC
jgi:hypothetical protein